ncbi:hypothetical protein NP233_g11330 [Leucocoprinus birnbaumii]|uniref:Uncharacterized protein n=1 Tax=Leucocoprinus birnbaumii TaxID=56174 RepID=A0AAD5VKG6_9AGAR|nr:hypothetical protein NP233_g11330 [Leucocoprinus birnbaumii]
MSTSESRNNDAEKRLVRKLDLTILPLFTMIYTFIYVDRSSLGNAQVAGMPNDLRLKNYDLSISMTVFFVIYAIMKIPSSLVVKHLGSTWIAVLIIGAGFTALGTAFTTDSMGLLLTRLFLALVEGGIGAGFVYLLARDLWARKYYRRNELVLRIITIGLGLLGLVFLPGDPSTTKLLTQAERELAIERIDLDSAVKTEGTREKTSLKLVLRSFNVWTCLCTFCFFVLSISYQAMNVFLPTILSKVGHLSASQAQLDTVPIFIAGAVWGLLSSYASFRWKNRAIPTLLGGLLHVIGYSLVINSSSFSQRYAACVMIYMGDCAVGILIMTWATDNAAPDTMRAVAAAAVPGLGSLGSIVGMWVFVPSEAPEFRVGNMLNLISGVIMVFSIALGTLYLKAENSKRERGDRDDRLLGLARDEAISLGYRHPGFRYQT